MYDVKEFKFKQDGCWFKSSCNNYKKDICNCGCPLYCQYYYLVNLANIPEQLQYPENQKLSAGVDIDKYKYLANIKENIIDLYHRAIIYFFIVNIMVMAKLRGV